MNPQPKSRINRYAGERSQRGAASSSDSSTPILITGRTSLSAKYDVPRSPHNNNKRKDSSEPGFSKLVKSRSIPIANGMKRTPSELQLCQDMEMADYRDFAMFTRIVDGIVRQQEDMKDYWLRRENDICLAHIIGTRNGSEDYLRPEEDAATTTPTCASHHVYNSCYSASANRYSNFDPHSLKMILDRTLEQDDEQMFILDL